MNPRLPALLLALACGAGLAALWPRSSLPPAPWMVAWSAGHPDTRDLGDAGRERHAQERAAARHGDALVLLAALGAGALAVAAHPAGLRAPAGLLGGLLVTGTVVVGLTGLVRSLSDVHAAAAQDRWTLSDDGLDAIAGPHAATLRAWRERVSEDEAVLVVGTQEALLNLTAWALHPRPVYPVLLSIPEAWAAEDVVRAARELTQGTDAPGRWLVDLRGLERGPESSRPALLRIAP